ncbi:MAG: MOSC domain-containing protein, partial [Anaerolineae bacterium]|nr:MOSC domain-containing protein [Anaerolineae bacterium]
AAPYRFNRVAVATARLIAGHGIEGDWKAGRNPKRQINLVARETLDGLAREGYRTGPGEIGEQIVVRGLDLMALAPGSRLRLGESALIEITMARTPCDWLGLVQGKPDAPTAAQGRVGVMARVIEGGIVRVGDPVQVIGGGGAQATTSASASGSTVDST